jgi:Uncharacterised nucleotidyltransferase
VTVHTAALLLETLRLDGHAEPEELRAAWANADTRRLGLLVQFEGCALWLRRRLGEINALESGDRRFRVWLEHRSREIAARNLLVDAQTDRVARALSDGGVPFVFIGGAARHALADTIPYADARATSDVDVLVPAERARHAWNQLRQAGYDPAVMPGKGSSATLPGLFRLQTMWDRRRVAVELHTSTSLGVSASEAWRRGSSEARRVVRAGVVVPVQACPTELVWHALTHAFSHDWEAFRLRFLLDATVICGAMPVNWVEIGRRLDSPEVQNRYYAAQWLGAAAALAGVTLPEELADRVSPFDLQLVLTSRLALLRRMTLHGRLGARLLDTLAYVAIAADHWTPRPQRLISVEPARAR